MNEYNRLVYASGMHVVEHQPPNIFELPDDEPLIFLAGPIQGAPFWQEEAVGIIGRLGTEGQRVHIANPRRDGPLDPDFSDAGYTEQVSWEERGLLRAAKFGAALFWFAKQDPEQPYEQGRAYAQTSRVEFGEILGWQRYNPSVRVIVGIEPGYKGSERYFRYKAQAHRIPVWDDLEAACAQTMRRLEPYG
jgi:hypothetical protein